MRALRLPAHALSLPYWFGRGTHALLSHSCSPRRSRRTERSPPGLEQLVSRRSAFRLVAPVDASGISQVPWRSVPCLCPAPGPRSSRGNLAFGGLRDAAPGFHKPKASTGRKYRGSHRASASAVYASRATSPPPMQDSLPAGGLRLYREGVEPSGSLRKVSDQCFILLSRACPVASGTFSKRSRRSRRVGRSRCRISAPCRHRRPRGSDRSDSGWRDQDRRQGTARPA